ncbi:SusC/RagA family TonB-linked outer membrane protein [Hymenobacter armeniacus]|uniref:SusC/RagA family TonB-linked outer membrane protein n=1 Tax=Hymenobacter armeniacus TaxID=2771358 RepID=A0ABR8JX06_9BACT|nr:SusC/RagA family TonB-linked outer membrane protein [Hymenobacter armeniacus]MBD2723115.1 SusC/RagA family TonB-linked outer membrane protein [Hymenobacter armeniacus]
MKQYVHKRVPGAVWAGILAALALPAAAQTPDSTRAVASDSVRSQRAAAQSGSFLEQQVALPFGPTISRRNTTAALSSIGNGPLRSYNTPNLGNTLLGQLSGLNVAQRGSAPGNNDTPALSIRGVQTFQDNAVTVLVDGFETNYTTLLPEEIESITVLKDAAALAVYGLDGANGVVLITTKRGVASGKNAITFSSRFGVQTPAYKTEFVSNGEYADLYNQGLLSDGKTIGQGYFSTPQIVDNFKSGAYPYLYPNVNWYDETIRPSTTSQDYNLTVRGGRPDAKYFVALGYADYNGLYANTDKDRKTSSNYNLQRFNLRANFDAEITKFLTAEIKLRGTMLNKTFPNAAETDIWRNIALFNPYPLFTPDGSYGGAQGYAENPAASIRQKGYNSINDRTVDANVKLIGKLDFLTRGLSVFGQVNFNNFYFSTYNKTRGYLYQELTARPDLTAPGQDLQFDAAVRGSSDRNFAITQGTGTQLTRTSFVGGTEYSRSFGPHAVYASAMYLQERIDGAGNEIPYAKQNIMGRVSYNFREKYFAELGYSVSGSENFPKGHRFGVFPSLSAGWVLSQESFLSGSKAVSFLKLRGSVGLLGNDRAGNSGRFIYNQFYLGAGSYLLGNNYDVTAATFRQGNLANPAVTWEKSLKANVGLDAVLYENLSVSVDVFQERRTDIFLNPSSFVSSIVGATFNNVNRGETQNRGAEVELSYRGTVGPLGYRLGGNASYAKNKIINIEEPYRPEEYLRAEGRSINQPFILESIGFFQNQAEIDQSPKQLFGEVRPGDVKYKDQNNDGFIDDKDRVAIGNTAVPNFYYGFSTGFDFKGFDLNVFFQGAASRSVSLLDNNNVVPFLNGGVKPTPWVRDNYWTPERGNAAQFPRLTTEANPNNYRPSTLWQRDGSFIRLRNVELGYTLPLSVSSRLKLSTVRVYVSGNNLYTWDRIKELTVDPEIMNVFVHPSLKSYNFGFSVQL